MGLLGGNDAKINATFTATDKASPVIKGLRSNVASMGTKTGGPLGGLLGGLSSINPASLVAGVGIGALTGLVVDSVGAFKESQKIQQQTVAVLKSTGGAAGITADEVGNLAQSISDYSGTDDEAVQAGENLLLTFTNIKNQVGAGNDIFNQATVAITDMSQALGQDMKSSAIQLGKALNDPIKGVTALQRVGVSFTKAQKDQIITLVKTGKTLEAQKLILHELNTEFGGSAKAFGDSFEGQEAKISNAIGNLEENLGGFITNGLSAAASATLDFIHEIGHLGDAFNNLHRFIDPDYAAFEDTRKAAIAAAGAYGLSADAVQNYIDTQRRARATATQVVDDAENLKKNEQYLADQYGITVAELEKMQGTQQAQTQAQLDQAKAVAYTSDYFGQYLDDLRESNTLTQRNAEALGKSTSMAAAYRKRLKEMTGETSTDLANANAAMANFESGWHGLAINVPNSIEAMAIKTHAEFKTMLKQDKADMKQLIHDINHPGDNKNLLKWLPKAMDKAQHELHVAQKNGDKIAIAEATAFLAQLEAQYMGLTGTYYVKTAFVSGGGGRMRQRAGGGPVNRDSTYLVGENGPEVLHMGNGASSGYVTQGRGSGGAQPVIHTHVYIDGREVMRAVDKYNGLGWANAGSSSTRN